MQRIVVIGIIILSVLYLAFRLARSLRAGSKKCCGGCGKES